MQEEGINNNQFSKISIICALYIGDRPVQVDDISWDKLHYFKKQLQYFEKYRNRIHKFYFVTTFQDGQHLIDYKDKLMKYEGDVVKIIIKENLGGSYTSWKEGLKQDAGDSDLVFLIEDDYVVDSETSINLILSDFQEEPSIFYYCGLWRENHAAISNGVINNKLYHNSNLEFQTINEISRNALFTNQLKFLEPFRKQNYYMKDYRRKYSSIFSDGVNKMIEYGRPSGNVIFHPLTKVPNIPKSKLFPTIS